MKNLHPYLENQPVITPPDIRSTHYMRSHSYPAHFHNNVEILYCFRGVQEIRLGNIPYSVKAGEAVIIFPNVAHEYVENRSSDIPTDSLFLICSLDFLSKSFPKLITHRPLSPVIPAEKIPQSAIHIFEQMCVSTGTRLLGWTLLALSDLLEGVELVPIKYSDDFRLAPHLIAYIDANFQKPLTLKHLAMHFGYSSTYIASLFYGQLKIPFRTYLGNVRSEHAANLIRTTNKSLTEISYECGYNSTNTFCRNFKRCYSITPSEYKRSLSKK